MLGEEFFQFGQGQPEHISRPRHFALFVPWRLKAWEFSIFLYKHITLNTSLDFHTSQKGSKEWLKDKPDQNPAELLWKCEETHRHHRVEAALYGQMS